MPMSPSMACSLCRKHGPHNWLYFLLSRTPKRPFTTSPLSVKATSYVTPTSISRKTLCFALLDDLLLRGLFDSAQKVIHRIIRQVVNSGEHHVAESVYVEYILKRGIEPDHSLLNSMVFCYYHLGKLEESKLLFDTLVDMKSMPCTGAFNVLIKEFCARGRILDGFGVFVKACGLEVLLSFSCYNRLVDGLCYRGYLDKALYVFDIMRDRRVLPTVHLFKTLVVSLCKRGEVEEAELLSLDMESYGFVLDKVMYTTLINVYCKTRKMNMGMRVFLRMLKLGCEPDKYTYNTLIHGFFNVGMFNKGWVLYRQMVESGLEPDAVTYQISIVQYCKTNKVDCALKLLDDMIRCNVAATVHSYTALISALCRENRLAEADDLYNKMLDNGLVPDHVLFFTMVNNLPRGLEISVASKFLLVIAKKNCGIDLSCIPSPIDIDHILGEIVARDLSLANVAFNIYLIALCLGGNLDSALICMDKMASLSLQPSVSAYNSLIKSLFQKGRLEEAESFFEIMQDQGHVPNQATFLIMVNAYCKLGNIQSTVYILDQINEGGLNPNVAIYDSIIRYLGREKRVKEVRQVFLRMVKAGFRPDKTMYVTMVNALARNGRVIQATKLFEQMLEYGIPPNHHAYNALITGLVKKNMIEMGCLYLDRMINQGIMPNTVLYTSLINQFFRKRDFKFAFKLFDLMERSEIERDMVTSITLVSGISRNIWLLDGEWIVPGMPPEETRIPEEFKEMLFQLLDRSAMKKCLKISSSPSKQIKLSALKLIKKVKDAPLVPNLYLHNSLIFVLCWAEGIHKAYEHLDTLQSKGLQPNHVTFTILIDGHLRSGEINHAVSLFNGMSAHGCPPDKIVHNTLMKGLCKRRRVVDALSVLCMMLKKGFTRPKECMRSKEYIVER